MTLDLTALFRDELQRQTAILAARLPARGSGPATFGPDAELFRAASALRSAAKVMARQPLDAASEAIETILAPLDKEAMVLTREELDALHRVVAALEGLGSADDFGATLEMRSHEIAELAATLRGLRTERAPGGAAGASRSDNTLELFKLECEIHAATLGDGLLHLEREPQSVEVIERIMRAAHSLKGAARVIGLDGAVRLAHAMEDHLTRARRGEIAIDSDTIEVLLRGTDLLLEVGRSPEGDGAPLSAHAERVLALGKADVAAQPPPASVAAQSPAPPAAISAEPRGPGDEEDRVLRVKASHISRLVGLAGESLVEARRLQPFAAAQHRLRARQAGLSDLVNDVHQAIGAPPGDDPVGVRIAELRARVLECRTLLNSWVEQFEEHAKRSEELTLRLYQEASASRMRPLSDGLHAFGRMVRDLARKLGKSAELSVSGDDLAIDRDVIEKLEAPLTHILRNCVDHGIETMAERKERGKPERGTIHIDAKQRSGMIVINVSDDGRGLAQDKIRAKVVKLGLLREEEAARLEAGDLFDFIFAPGFSTADSVTEVSGRGVGLDVVLSTLSELGGSIHVSSEPSRGTTFQITVAISRQVIRAVVVSIAGEPYAFPLGRIDRLVRAPLTELRLVEDRQYLLVDDQSVALVPTSQVLELQGRASARDLLHVVVVSDRTRRFGFAVDAFLGEHDLVIRPLDPRLGRVSDVSAASTLQDGAPVLIVDVDDLVRSVLRLGQTGRIQKIDGERTAPPRRKRVLVVDDSITVRELERQLLANRGFDVEVAVDGANAWGLVRDSPFDLVVTDVDMPRMDGIALTRSIKQDPRLRDLPVIMVSYRDSAADRARGLEAKADFYLAKSEFQDEALLEAVTDLIGSPIG